MAEPIKMCIQIARLLLEGSPVLEKVIEENRRQLEYLTQWGSTSSLESAGTTSSKDKWKQGARKTLLNWVSNALPIESGVQIKDFGASWRDGVAFLAIIDAIKKNLVNIAEMKKASNKARLETAFDVAETELGITRLLDPEDVDVPKPDEKSIMTYVAQFLHKYPEPKSTGPDAVAAIQEEYSELLSWLIKKTQYLEHLEQTNSLPLDYNEYLAFKSEVEEKEQVYTKLKHLIESQSSISIAKESWFDLNRLWDKLQQQLLHWLWALDSRLPGDFKFVGEWLAKAEQMIYCDEIPITMNEETAAIISRKLEEHKAFFADLPTVQQKFAQAYQSPLAREVPSEQLNNMAVRLNEIGPKAVQRRVRLKFLEHKCCLIAFLQLTETKLKAWTAKYGRVDKVIQLLEQYRNFVSKNHIFQEFNKAFIDMQAVIEEYRRDGNIDKKELIEIDAFMRDIAERWKNVSMELRCVQSMLEEVVAYWRRWDSLADEFDTWLSKAEQAVNTSEDEKMEFFQDISVWRDNYQLLGDTVSFLIATCEDRIALDLRDRYQTMTDRWNKLYPQVNKYSHAGDILRNRKDFRAGVEVLSNWLRKAETVLSAPSLGSMERIRQHTDNLMKLQGEVEEIENLFKNISKAFQTLIQDLSREEVDKMMTVLKHEKEALVRVRALIPSQIHLFNQLLVQQESLEAGQKEINVWLDSAESLLSHLTLEGDKEQLKEQMDKLKHFFTRILYYKSMLDSKNKVLNNIIKSVDQAENPDVAIMTARMEQLNDRFDYVAQNAQLWEQRLQEAARCWYNFSECEKIISNWLNRAEKLTLEKRIDSKETVEDHKNFFQSVNERWIHDLVQSAQDLCNCLPKDQHTPILASVDQLQNKWRDILSFAPLHLMKLEFRLDESTFNYYIKEIEKEIITEHIAFTKQENVESIITRNKEFFSSRGPLLETHQCLENLMKINNIYSKNCPQDKSVEEAVERAQKQWQQANIKLENLKQELDQIPEKWQSYHNKFQEMSKWMDSVDNALKNILNDVNTMEEFEREKAVFQNICKEADSKREDMKWLVQTLDSLTSHCPENQAILEQKNLESLIIRYKNLIPSLEITMVKTDTLSKCYTYRREVKEVCQLLKQVREQSKREIKPQSLETLSQSINKQEVAISQLDQQRPTVMSLLQKGKELSKDDNAPSFIKEEVTNLETGWSKTYDETVETLHKLIGTHHLWSNYTEQKTEITTLLEKAERDLSKLPQQQYTPHNIPTELLAKQELAIRLREAIEDMLRKLRETCNNLTKQVPEQKPIVEKEVQEIEQRLDTTLSDVTEKMTLLEQYNTKWNTFQTKLGHLQSWTVQDAPQLISSVEEYAVTPKDRVEKVEKLKSEVVQKLDLLNELNKDAQDILISDSPEARKHKAEVAAIQEKVLVLNKTLDSQTAIVTKDLQHWKTYQASLQEIKPWIENAEIKIQQGFPKPGSLEEAVQLQIQTKQFGKETDQQLKKLQGASDLAHELSTKSNAPDEIDFIQTRCSVIHDTSAQWAQKLDKLVANWVDFDKNVQHLDHWVVKSQDALTAHPVNLETPNVDKLEKELIKLKAFNNEISEQQAKLIALTQSSDSMSYSVTPEGATLVKDQVQMLKAKVNDLAESARAKINEVSDAILVKHDFQKKVADYSNWLESMKANVAQIDEVPADKVDSTLLHIHTLLQEHSEKQPLFHTIYNEIKNVSLQSPRKELEPLTQEYTTIVQHNQDTEHKLQEKKMQLQKWSDLLNWHTETSNQLSHVKYQCESEKLTPDVIQKLISETNAIIDKVIHWKETAPQIDKSQCVTILDRQTCLPRSADNVVREIEVKAINLKSQLADKLDGLEKLKSRWNNFEDLQKKVVTDLDNTKKQLSGIKIEVKHSSDLPKAVEQLQNMLEAQNAKLSTKENLRKEALQLIKEDIQNISAIQNSVSEIESNWNKVNEDIKEEKLKLSYIILAWNEFQEAKDHVVKDIGKIDKSIENLQIPNDMIQANVNSEKAKKALDAIKKSKAALDKADAKGQIIIRKADNIPGIESEVKRDMQIVNDVWSKIYERILKTVQTTESQSTIWKHIEEAKSTLVQWLGDQNKALVTALEKPNEQEAVASILAKYKEERPAHLRLNQSIPHKYSQLLKLTDNTQVPTIQSLMQLLDDQFKEVEDNAQKLEAASANFNEKEKAIRGDIKNLGNKISSLREEIIKCEDLSGDNSKILERLLKVRQLKGELQNHEDNIKKLEQDIQNMKQNYPSLTTSTIPKEQQLLKKRFDGIFTHASKIEHSLSSFLKKFHNEKYGALQRIIATHKEKIQWCIPEPASDKYNLQVKLNALEPIQIALVDCEKRKEELETSMKQLEQIEKPETMKLLEAEKDHLFMDLESLRQDSAKTKNLLEHDISLHDKYEQLSESIANWLKDTENKVKTEGSLLMDMNNVDKKIKEISKLQKDVKDFGKEIDKLSPVSKQLIKEMPESRVAQYVQHLNTRYQALDNFLTHYLEKLEGLDKNKVYIKIASKKSKNGLSRQSKVASFSKIAKKLTKRLWKS